MFCSWPQMVKWYCRTHLTTLIIFPWTPLINGVSVQEGKKERGEEREGKGRGGEERRRGDKHRGGEGRGRGGEGEEGERGRGGDILQTFKLTSDCRCFASQLHPFSCAYLFTNR